MYVKFVIGFACSYVVWTEYNIEVLSKYTPSAFALHKHVFVGQRQTLCMQTAGEAVYYNSGAGSIGRFAFAPSVPSDHQMGFNKALS